MKKLFISALLLLTILLPAAAQSFEIDGIYYTLNGHEATVTYGRYYSGNVTIPSAITYNGDTYPVTKIGMCAFEGCCGLTNIAIPNSVIEIGICAFTGCSGLTNINIPNSVIVIGNSAFQGCFGLTVINIPNSVTEIGNGAFADCSGLTRITVASGNQQYDSRNNCNAIIETSSNTLIACCKNTIIPNSVNCIGVAAFYGCTGITSVSIPNSVTTIDYSAFFGCSGLIGINIPNSVTTIGYAAFSQCTNLRSIIIPNSVTDIGDQAFYGNFGLTSITLPNSLSSIGQETFYGCTGLTFISIPNSVTSIGLAAFADCWNLTSITIPNSVTLISDYAFANCHKLNDYYCYITDPSSVTMTQWEEGAIFYKEGNNYDNCTLHVPKGTIEAYQTDTRWNPYFGSIVEMEQEDPVLAASIELNVTAADMNEGKALQLTAKVLPEDATYKSVSWTSSDETIATVDNSGLVAAIGSGTATITATTTDGSNVSATCSVAINTHATNSNGDVNGDGQINISDVTALINRLLTLKH